MKEQQENKGQNVQPDTIDKYYETIIIGGGQAGLSVGYGLLKKGRSFLILDDSKKIGDAWRNRWDSLRLFTPAYLNKLDGMQLPGNQHTLITKDEMADYLEAYAQRFKLPIQSDVRVERLYKQGNHFIVSAGDKIYQSKNVVVAVSSFQTPRIPEFAKEINPSVVQLNTKDYRNPSQLKEGKVLIVGAGNSGAEIALDVVKEHQTFVSGRDVGHIPFRIETAIARYLLIRLVRFFGHNILNTSTPMGRRLRPRLLHSGGPLVRTKPKDLTNAGIERVARVSSVKNGLPILADNRVLEVENIIWCTGFSPGFSWIELPVLDEKGEPFHKRGIIGSEPGLYFVGLHFLYAVTSATVTGMKRDARYIIKQIVNAKD